ncbi:hypothetical protein COE18_04180 [Bacillus cereus]|nr:hypothetical protein COE18_04180 [Bacillus cereus]
MDSENSINIMELRHKANEIRKDVLKEKRIFEKALRNITGSTQAIEIRGEIELKEIVIRAEDYAKELCSKLSPSCIPLLAQMCELFYYGAWKLDPPWLGTCTKRTIAMIYKNQFKNGVDFANSKLDILEALYAVRLAESLIFIEMIGSFTEPHVKLTREEIVVDDANTKFYWNELSRMYSDRGKSHRTLRDSINTWARNPKKFLQSIENILKGEEPSKQPFFKDTLFGHLPLPTSQGKKDFWEQLRSLMHLSIAVSKKQYSDGLLPDSVVVLPGSKLLNEKKPGEFQFEIRSDIYWKESWYNKIIKTLPVMDIKNILVHRPIIGFSKDPNLNITSIGLIADAINYFVETSIFDYVGIGTPFKDAYKKIIATPFEMEVQRIVRANGFYAGDVYKKGNEKDSPSGIWNIQVDGIAKEIELIHRDEKRFPGEIDLLAYHPQKKMLILVECKTFQIPHTKEEMDNLKDSFIKTSKGKYQYKLERKAEWIQNSICVSGMKDMPIDFSEIEIEKFFVIDRYIVDISQETRIPVIDVEYLKEALSKLNALQMI